VDVDEEQTCRGVKAATRDAEGRAERSERGRSKGGGERASAGAAAASPCRRAAARGGARSRRRSRPKGPAPPLHLVTSHCCLASLRLCILQQHTHSHTPRAPAARQLRPRHGRRPRRLHSRPRRGGRRAQECPSALPIAAAEGTSTPPGRGTARKPRHGRLLGRVLPRRRDCRASALPPSSLHLELRAPPMRARACSLHVSRPRPCLGRCSTRAASSCWRIPREQHRLTLYASAALSFPRR